MTGTLPRATTGALSYVAGGLRKQPLQERSRATIDRILQVAERLVVEIGYEAVIGTPTLLLDETGVSRGSFYTFFESPERVLDELSLQHMQKSTPMFIAAITCDPEEPWQAVVDGLLDFQLEQHRMPLVRELWVRQHLTRRVRDIDRVWIDEAARDLCAALRERDPGFEALTPMQCGVAIHTSERLFQLAFRDDPAGDPVVLQEARAVVAGYFAAKQNPAAGAVPQCV